MAYIFLFRLVDAFEGKIESTVEDNISKKIGEGVVKLDSSLGSLPREISLAHVAVLNVTFVGSPVLSSSSIEFKIDGLFSPSKKTIVSSYNRGDTEDSSNGISRRENILDSASRVPFIVSSYTRRLQFFFTVSLAKVFPFSCSISVMKLKVLSAMLQLRCLRSLYMKVSSTLHHKLSLK